MPNASHQATPVLRRPFGHQLGAACAALFAGFVRSAQGDYPQAFMIAGATGIVAAVLSLMIGRRPAQPVLAAA